MKKNASKLIALVLILTLTLSMAACGKDGSDQPVGNSTVGGKESTVMKVSIGVSESHFEYLACEKMKEYIEKATDGSIKVELYPSGQIGNDQEVLEGLPLGITQMLPCGSDLIGNISPNYGLLSLPYLFDKIEEVDAVMEGDFGNELLAELDAIGYKGLGFGYFGFRHITNNVRPIETVEDLKGLKIRTMTTPIHLDMFTAMGANPTSMAFSELFSALQQGVIDGQENPLMNIYSNKLHEVQKYLTLDGHVFTFVTFVTSKDWFDGLTPEQQLAVQEGVNIATNHMKDAVIEEDNLALEEMVKAGIELTELTPKEKEGFIKAVEGVRDEYGNKINPEMYKKLLTDLEAAK